MNIEDARAVANMMYITWIYITPKKNNISKFFYSKTLFEK